MSCLGFKGGIGTASRVTAEGHTVAVLLMTNFGERHRLTVAGVPVGRLLPGGARRSLLPRPPAGSCIGLVVTDAPSTGPAAPGWPAESGSAWPGPVRSPTTAAARSSWRRRPVCAWTDEGVRRRHVRCDRAGSGSAVRSRRGGKRGGCAQLDAWPRRTTVGRGRATLEWGLPVEKSSPARRPRSALTMTPGRRGPTK